MRDFKKLLIWIKGMEIEGRLKRSEKEYKHYAEIALGSAFEPETHLLIVQEQGWVPTEKVNALSALVTEEQRC